MIQDEAFFGARTPIVQTFKPKGTGKPFSVIVNHFKSKGGANRAEKADKNKGDGQGAYNAKRRGQALAICNFIEENSRGNQQPRVLVIGDLNAYEQEDPIDALRANGLVDLHELVGKNDNQAQAPKSYSYVYRGQSGSLDHAFGTKSLAKDVTGVAVWNINADEPRSMDYNQEFKPKELFKPDPFRSSDHDPVLIGIKN
jgi:predicted extracellular nuclease